MERGNKQDRTQVEHERPLISAIYATDALNARRVHFPTRLFSSADDASVARVHSRCYEHTRNTVRGCFMEFVRA